MTAQAVTTIAPAEPRDPFFALVERAATDPAFDPDKVDRLYQLWQRGKQDQAEAEFNDAMAIAQGEMEPVRTDAYNSQTKSKYASYAALDRQVRPIYSKHGFCLTFNNEDIPGDEVRVVCLVSRGRFTRRYQVDMPTDGKGAKGGDVMTKTHAMKSANTYGRNTLLQNIFNLAVDKDDDGNAAGGKTYMGAPYPRPAERRGAQPDGTMAPPHESSVRVHADNPVTLPVTNAHTLALGPGENLTQWTGRYVAALGLAQTGDELAALKEGNQLLLAKVIGSTNTAAAPAQESLRTAEMEARKRVAEARPTLAEGNTATATATTPDASPASTASSKPAVTIGNYTLYIEGLVKNIATAETEAGLEITGREITRNEACIFPPDLEMLMQKYRHRKEALKP